MRRRLLSVLVCLCMLLTLMPGVVLADETGATVTGASGEVSAADGVWTLDGGAYTVTGTATDSQAIVLTGDVTLTMNSAVLKHTTADTLKYAPAIYVKSGSAKLVLQGENSVEGSSGYAGIAVAPGASMTISGEGSLQATGGAGSDTIRDVGKKVDFGFDSSITSVYYGGGAGIGGNGIWMSGADHIIGASTADCGTIAITSGTVTATGGKANSMNAGAGAGIGGGGNTTKAKDATDEAVLLPAKGTVKISGGTVTATGGDGESWSLTGGGAGIGCGGSTGAFYTADNEALVEITGGTVTATGLADGAGIGGGANVDGGTVKITAGTVTATGGAEFEDGKQDGGYGGAGIGGGDNGGVTAIEISGGTVKASAIGAAAGIGAGNSGAIGAGTITISGAADVTAVGGCYKDGLRDGGAGIGGGRSNDNDCGFAKIAITGTAKVRAYAGAKAQAIGVGTYYDTEAEFANKLEFASTADIWMFTKDNTHGAFWGQNEDGTLSADVTATNANLIWFTGAETPAAEMVTAVTTKDAGLTWQYTADRKVQVLKGDKVAAEETYREGYTLGNWAALYTIPQVTVTYKLDADDENPATETVDPGTSVTVKDAPAKEGYVFTGWSDGENRYLPGATLTPEADLTLTAQWQAIDSWSQEPSDDGDGKLAVDVDVQVKVDASTGASAEVKDSDKAALAQQARQLLRDVLSGKTPDGLTDDEAAQLRQVLGSGASLVEAKITLTVTLTGDLTEEQAKALEGAKTADDSAQVWELTISLGVTAKEGKEVLGGVEKIALHKTDAPISITLKTGLDLDEQDVRVLYLHDDAVKTASASVQDAAGGVIALQASEFSPYIILYKTTKYAISIPEKTPTGGSVSASSETAAKGETVTVTVTPSDGYRIGTVTVTDAAGNAVALTVGENGTYTFQMPGSAVTVAATFAEQPWNIGYRDCPKDETCPIWPFTDATTTAWYHDGVHFCLENGLMVGYGQNIFAPQDATTRAMVTAMLWRLNGSPAAGNAAGFADVAVGTWYHDAIVWAKSVGVVAGYDADTFGPNDVVTREQMMAIFYRYAKYTGCDVSTGSDASLGAFEDNGRISAYAVEAMRWAYGCGLLAGDLQGEKVLLAPQGSTTRAQMATFMMRFCAEIEK